MCVYPLGNSWMHLVVIFEIQVFAKTENAMIPPFSIITEYPPVIIRPPPLITKYGNIGIWDFHPTLTMTLYSTLPVKSLDTAPGQK